MDVPDVSPARAVAIGRAVVREMRAENVTFMAGSIAYAAFLSLLPLLLLLLIVASAVGNDVLAEHIVGASRTYLTPAGEGLVVEALTNASERAGASVVGVVSLVWGMLRIFRGIRTAFAELYDTVGEQTLLDQVRDGLVVFVAIVAATVGASFAVTAFALFPEVPFIGLLNPLALVAGLTIAFFPMYYVFPDVDVSPREVLPGVILAAVGWAILEAVFQVYVAYVDTIALYGTVGGVILLLIWLYASALVLLAGATLNVVIADRHRKSASRGAVALWV